MIRRFASFMLAVAAVLTAMASEPFIGTLRNTRGKPVKGVKVFLHTPKDAVKSNKNGEFKFEDVDSTDFIHIDYKGREYGFAVNGRHDMMLVVGEDGRIFERENYVGETFHGHLIDYKGKPIRGAAVYASDPFDYVKSDRDGKFLLDNVIETDTLHIKHDGYIHDIAMDGSKGMYIKILRNTGRRADRDLVNTGAGMMDARDYNGPRAVRTAKELEAMGTQDIALAMQGMKGVTVSRNKNPLGREAKYEVYVRGSKPMWILDGVRMSEKPDLTVMEVEKIEVLHDGGMYGIGGFGGVVNITTKGSNF
ncbi:MAG: carboxypeptidase-like regulatory domain-containing protein [Muribaculaceae bacterium]|nr:carboxypeptidase-like regulatory domain-containing protein [Muribaculaceae bacterium]